jgi:D-aspartate ligase
VDDRPGLVRSHREACRLVNPKTLMIQDFVSGGGNQQLSMAALCSEGRVLASLTARRQRQYPIDFGRSSSLVVTIQDAHVHATAVELLAAMRWTGVIELEFKRDPRTRQAKLLDANPRGWTWWSLGARAGVDFPYLLWRLHAGESVEPVHARSGVRWVRFGTDLPAAVALMRRKELSLGEYVASLRPPLAFPGWSPDDPVPAVVGPLVRRRGDARPGRPPTAPPAPSPLSGRQGLATPWRRTS